MCETLLVSDRDLMQAGLVHRSAEANMTSRIISSILVLSAIPALCLVSSSALADETCGDTTCPTGFVCNQGESPCAAPVAREGDTGDVEQDPIVCEPEIYYYCSAASCTSNSDCGADQVCNTTTEMSCSGGGATIDCDPDAPDCQALVAEDPPECEEDTVSQCTFKWDLPCTEAADCGPNFTCEPEERCSCSGSAGAGGAAGTDPGDIAEGSTTSGVAEDVPSSDPAEPARPVDCGCEPTGISRCQVIQTKCSDDSDCSEGWTCQANPNGMCSIDSDGKETCETDGPAKLCLPPYSNTLLQGADGGDVLVDSEDASVPRDEQDNGETATGDKAGDDDDDDDDAADSANDSDQTGSSPKASEGGCSVGGMTPSSGSAIGLLLGLGAIVGLRRRRA